MSGFVLVIAGDKVAADGARGQLHWYGITDTFRTSYDDNNIVKASSVSYKVVSLFVIILATIFNIHELVRFFPRNIGGKLTLLSQVKTGKSTMNIT